MEKETHITQMIVNKNNDEKNRILLICFFLFMIVTKSNNQYKLNNLPPIQQNIAEQVYERL